METSASFEARSAPSSYPTAAEDGEGRGAATSPKVGTINASINLVLLASIGGMGIPWSQSVLSLQLASPTACYPSG